MEKLRPIAIFFCGVLVMANCTASVYKLIEAQSFENYGGWVIDTQSEEQMGPPICSRTDLAYLLKAP